MIEPINDQTLTALNPEAAQGFTAERVLRTRPKTYRTIVQLLADPDAKIEHIAKQHRVSTHTVRAIRAREAQAIAERKQRLMSVFANVAEMAAERMEELAGQATLRDAGVTAGIATDKLLALSGDPGLMTINIEPFDIGAELRKLNEEARKSLGLPAAKAQVIETNSCAQSEQPVLPDSGTQTVL